ncbi:uncharacterized protein LOC116259672 [Nymphaea colorata]|nr:uncharacterized protein LOC116259672 [Nymphaea colorata]
MAIRCFFFFFFFCWLLLMLHLDSTLASDSPANSPASMVVEVERSTVTPEPRSRKLRGAAVRTAAAVGMRSSSAGGRRAGVANSGGLSYFRINMGPPILAISLLASLILL